MGNALTLPKGFVFEDEQTLPEGFVFEDAKPVFDPVAEDDKIKASVGHAHKANLPVSDASLHHDSLQRIEKKRPIGFVEGVTEDALYKVPFVGAAIQGTDLLRLKMAGVRLNDSEFDWDRAAQTETLRERRKRSLKSWTAETLKQRDEKLVVDYIETMSERAERGMNVWGKIGSGLSTLPGWMIEFAMTAGLAQAGSVPVKKFLQTHMKTKLLAKTAGWISGSVARTTVGMPHRVFANTMQRSLENDEGWATSIAKGWGQTMIEVTSETAGEGIVGGAKWVMGGVINKLSFGKKFLSALQKSWTKLSPDNTAAKFAKRVATKGGYNGLIGEFGEERLASLMHAVAGTETFGLPKGASIEDRLIAAVKQDLDASNLVSEAVVLSVPGAIKVSVAHLGEFADNRKLAKAIEEQVGVSPEVAKTAVGIKTKEGIEAADTYLSQVKTEGEEAAEAAIAEKAPTEPAKPLGAAPLVMPAKQAVKPVAKGVVQFDLSTEEGRTEATVTTTARAKDIADKLGFDVSEDELFTTVNAGKTSRGTSHGDAGISMFLAEGATQEDVDRIIIHELGHTLFPSQEKGLSVQRENEKKIQAFEEEQLAKLKGIEARPTPVAVEGVEPTVPAVAPAAEEAEPSSRIQAGLEKAGFTVAERGKGVAFGGQGFKTFISEDGNVKIAVDNAPIFVHRGDVRMGDPTDRTPNTLTVQGLIVEPDVRGQGLASKAMQELHKAADEAGITLVGQPGRMGDFVTKGQKSLSTEELVVWYKKLGWTQQTHGSNLILERQPAQPAPAAEVTPEVTPGVEEGAGGIAWQTAMKNVLALAEKDRPLVVKEQKEARSQRVGAMAGTLESLRKKGVAGKEAIHRASGQLKGALTDYEGRYQPLANIIEPAFIKAAENDIADNANLTPFDRLKLTNHDGTGAWDKMLRGAAMTPSDVAAIRKWQPILATEAAKRVPLSNRFWGGLEQLLGTLKFGAGFDIQTRRQARWLRGRHPVLFTKAVGRNVAAYISNEYADKMAAETEASPNYPMTAKYSSQKNGLKFLDRHPEVVVDRPEQFTSVLPRTLPFLGKRLGTVGKGAEVVYKYTGGQIGRVHAASMRGFIDSFNWMQQELWDWQINNWKQNNIDITPKMLHDLVDFQNTMMGMSKPKTTFGGAANRVLRPVMWSPSLTWSRVRTPSLILSNSTMRGEVAATLGTHIGVGLMYLGAASMIARWWDKDDVVEWDTNSSDFGKIKLDNTRWDVFGDAGPYMRAILQAWAGTKKNQAGRVTTKEGFDKLDPFKQLIRNKRAPAVDLLAKVWSGRNYYGGDAWALPDYDSMRREGGRKAEIADWHEKMMQSEQKEIAFFVSKEVYERYMPFFVQSTVEAAWFDGWPQALGAGTDEFFSGQALTYEPSTNSELQITQDIAATQEFNKLWDDLTPREQERLERMIPEMERLEIKKASEKLPPEEISLTKQNRAAKRIFKAMPDNVRKEMNDVGLKISAPARKIGRFFLNEERYKAYEEFTRQEIEASLTRRIETARWQTRSEVNRLKIMKDDMTNAKARARNRVLTAINREKL